jgi:DNA ligase (NAD+)
MGVLDDSAEGKEIHKIENCPVCGHKVQEVGAHLYCPNSLACPAQVVSKISHYASRDAMDIETLSEKTAQALHDKLGLGKLSDLYSLTIDNLLSLEGFKEKKAKNIINAIENKKNIELNRFIYALGIPNVGKKTAQDLADTYKTLENIMNANVESLLEVRDIGGIVARSIVDFFNDTQTKDTINELLNKGVVPLVPEDNISQTLEDKTFVITGTLEGISRRDAGELVKKNGGKVASSVSKNTDFLLAGEKAGSKLDKAQQLGVQIISLDVFMDMIS